MAILINVYGFDVIGRLGPRWQLEVLPRRYVLVVEGEDGNWRIDEEGRLIN